MRLLLVLLLGGCGSSAPPAAPQGSVKTEPTALVGHREVTPQDLAEAQKAGAVQLVDVRTPQEFASGHVPGARNLPIEEFTLNDPRLGWLDKSSPVYAICASGARSSIAARHLASGGYEALNVTGGTNRWVELGLPVQ